jgi:hypothetical protein
MTGFSEAKVQARRSTQAAANRPSSEAGYVRTGTTRPLPVPVKGAAANLTRD